MKLLSNLLLEDRVEFLKGSIEKISTDHDTLATHTDKNAIIDYFSHYDPTSNKQFLQWILKQYARKDFRQEDGERVKTALQNFVTYKGRILKKDINQYASIADVEEAVEPYLGKAASKKEETRIAKQEGAEVIFKSDKIAVYSVKTFEAECLYGSNTKWCTTMNEQTFKHYLDRGPLYIILTDENRKYQFHPVSDQFKDEKDQDFNIVALVKKYPELKDVAEFQGTRPEFMEHEAVEKHILSADSAKLSGYNFSQFVDWAINTAKVSLTVIEHLVDNHTNDSIHTRLLGHKRMTSTLIDKLIQKYGTAGATKGILKLIAKHPKTSAAGLRKMFTDGKDHYDLIRHLAHNPNLPAELMREIAKHDAYKVHIAANVAAPVDLLMELAADEEIEPWVVRALSTNPASTPEVLNAIDDSDKTAADAWWSKVTAPPPPKVPKKKYSWR